MPSDKARGRGFLIGIAAYWMYYTAWTIFLPLFDSSNPIHNYFPQREWAIRIPAFILALGISAIGVFAGKMMVVNQRTRE